MDEFSEPHYTHGHRAFLQAILARGCVSFREARPILAAIRSAESGGEQVFTASDIEEPEFQAYIAVLSRAASLFDYEIRTTVHQVSKERIWALVNTTSDPQTQLATTFTTEEVAYINRLLNELFGRLNSPRMEMMAIDGMQANKIARPKARPSQLPQTLEGEGEQSTQSNSDRGLKASEVDKVLASLVGGSWLEKSKLGFYTLSARGLLELRPWLIETFNDPDAAADEWQPIKFCEACKAIVTVGLRCSDPSCLFRIHDICEEAFWRTRRDQKCPRCSRNWEGRHYVGERALTSTKAYAKRKSGGRRTSAADDIIRQHTGEHEEEAEAGEDADDMES